jgi:hypothetical protein
LAAQHGVSESLSWSHVPPSSMSGIISGSKISYLSAFIKMARAKGGSFLSLLFEPAASVYSHRNSSEEMARKAALATAR